ncbi:MAG: ATP-binding cassette domain-containing protein [Candidatus Aenigmatarchaeota archaeon]
MPFDPVCGMEVSTRKFPYKYRGKKHYFCSPDCRKSFLKNPEKFLVEEPIIRLDSVWKTYTMGRARVNALQGLSMTIFKNEFIAIMGPSGSGKSTLMHLVGALDVPTRGKVFLEGKDISALPENTLAKLRGKKIGFVFQQFNLMPNLTALDNVMLPMIFQGVKERERRQRARKLLASVGIAKRAKHRPTEMSGGEQQRVAIARSLANDPDIILADEPTGNIDSATGRQIMNLLLKLHRGDKKTIVIVTHDPYIAGHAQRMMNIMDGKLLHDHVLAKKYLWAANRRLRR